MCIAAPQHSNNKNASHFSFEHDSTPHLEKLHFGKRFSFSSANEMNNEIAKENVQVVPEVKIVEEKVAAVVKEEVVVPTKAVEVDSFTYAGHRSARTGRSNEQTFSLWDSQEVNTSQVRPSSR